MIIIIIHSCIITGRYQVGITITVAGHVVIITSENGKKKIDRH